MNHQKQMKNDKGKMKMENELGNAYRKMPNWKWLMEWKKKKENGQKKME